MALIKLFGQLVGSIVMQRLTFSLFSLLILLSILPAVAQNNPHGQQAQLSTVKGKALDAKTNQGVMYASVIVRHLKDTTFISGGIADTTGKFQIENLKAGRYLLKISFIGYQTYVDTLKLFPPQAVFDLGNILLQLSSTTLNEVVVEGTKDAFEQHFDKKVFNVDRNNFSVGGSTLDVLKQVPAVNVDIDGKISVRGSENVQIFIDGKPAGLNADNRSQILEQIPANSIQSIEVISNPSAKYDAEGMNGIINIVSKKNNAKGNNGSLILGIGTKKRGNFSASLNNRGKKWNLGHSIGARYTVTPTRGYQNRTNFLPGIPEYSLDQTTKGEKENYSFNFNGNTEFKPNSKQNISANYLASWGRNNENELTTYNFLDSIDQTYFRYNRNTNSATDNITGSFSLNYTWSIKDKTQFTASANSSYNQFDGHSDFSTQNLLLTGESDGSPLLIDRTKNSGYIFSNTAQADLNFPIKKISVETGIKGNNTQAAASLFADSLDQLSGNYLPDSLRINDLTYNQTVAAAYYQMSRPFGKWRVKAGVRGEQTILKVYQQQLDTTANNHYLNLFPSFYISRKFKGQQEINFGYSRRINRPGSQQLNPFPDYNDPLNIRRGNPLLKPELVDAIEFAYEKYFTNHTLSGTLYFRQINNQIQRVRTVDSTGVSTVTFLNLSYSQNAGIEFFSRHTITKMLSVNTNINAFRTFLNGNNLPEGFTNSGFNFNAKAGVNYKFLKTFELQLSGNCNAPMVLLQGHSAFMYSADASLRKDFWKGKGSLVINWSDIFNSRAMLFYTSSSDFESVLFRKRDNTYVNVSFTYKFGNQQNNQNQKKQQQMPDQQNMDMGY